MMDYKVEALMLNAKASITAYRELREDELKILKEELKKDDPWLWRILCHAQRATEYDVKYQCAVKNMEDIQRYLPIEKKEV